MKHKRWHTCLQSIFLSFGLSCGALGCLVTGFGLDRSGVLFSDPSQIPYGDLTALILCCLAASVIFSVCSILKWELLPLCGAAIAGGFLWQEGTLAASTEALVYYISRAYHNAYGLGVLRWSEMPLLGVESTPVLCALGCCIAFGSAWTVCRRQWAFPAVMLSVLPLAACLVVTDSVPGTWSLYLYGLSLLVLILSQTARRSSAHQGNRLALLVLLPTALGLALLFAAIPRDTYRGQERADRILQQLADWTGIGGTGLSATVQSQEDLAGMGALYNPHVPVMEVTSQKGGLLYLREQGFSSYDGKRWYNQSSIDLTEWMQVGGFAPTDTITITTRNPQALLFTPYFVTDATMGSADGTTPNPDRLRSYTWQRQSHFLAISAPFPDTGPKPPAVVLPESTQQWAGTLARSILGKMQTEPDTSVSVAEKARLISEYVEQSARYSKGTGRMPSDQEDFARWFLLDSDTGYCVHFATATAVLLRSLGIPAQYVTGYTVHTAAGEPATVYRDDAHAWVEYYIPGVGWQVLDSTPGAAEEPAPLPPQTTAPSTEMTRPIPSLPEETTSGTTEPSQAPAPTSPGNAPARPAFKWAKTLIWLLLTGMGCIALLIGQWKLRLILGKRRMTTGNPNRRAIACWQETVRLARLLKERPDKSLFALTQKARFSQYALAEAELDRFAVQIAAQRQRLRNKPWYFRLLLRLVFAAY